MRSIKGLTIIVLTSMVFLYAAAGAAEEKTCPVMNMPNEMPYNFVMPSNPADQVVARGTCETFLIKPTLQGESDTFTVRIEGQGFTLSGGTNPQEVQVGPNGEIIICSDATACGSGLLFIGNVEIGSVRSDVGTWVLVSENECAINEDPNGSISSYIYDSTAYQSYVEMIQGKGRQREVISKYYRSHHVDCGSGETGLCDDFSGTTLGGFCDMSLDLNIKRKRCLGTIVMPYGGGYPCAAGYSEPSQHWSWCGCILYLAYHEWRCSP